MALIPPERLIDWTPGVYVGVPGGIDQYRPGGASERTTLVNVTEAPYYASGTIVTTTGTIDNGSDELTVADASTWRATNSIRVGLPAIQEVTITGGCTTTNFLLVGAGVFNSTAYTTYGVSLTAGDTAEQVAAKIRATWPRNNLLSVSGTGAVVRFTNLSPGPRVSSFVADESGRPTGVTFSFADIQTGTLVADTTVASVAGNVLTLTDAASAAVTDGTVEHHDGPAIQAAINATGAGEVTYLPAGTYRTYQTLSLGVAFSEKTMRGDGTSTILETAVNTGIQMGEFSGPYFPPTPTLVTGGLTKGSTTITVNNSQFESLTTDQVFSMNVENDPSVPVVSVYNYDVQTNSAPTSQGFRATGTTSNTISVTPPLHDDYGGGSLEIRLGIPTFLAKRIGLEDMVIDASNYSTSGGVGAYAVVHTASLAWGWIYNCTIKKAHHYNLNLSGMQLEVRKCFFDGIKGTGSNGAGILIGMHSSLIEDNIILDAFPLIEVNSGSSGNVIAYNYGSEAGFFDTNHAPHNRFNLYEGNAVGYMMSDGYFGGEGEPTFFRNLITNSNDSIYLKRFTRAATAVGNILPKSMILGYPNIGNSSYDGTAQPSMGDYWRDYNMTGTLTTRTGDQDGVLTLASGNLFPYDGFTYQVIRLVWGAGLDESLIMKVMSGGTNTVVNIGTNGSPGALPPEGTVVNIGPGAYFSSPNGSYQELDLDVEATLIRKGNYYLDETPMEPLDGDTMPPSLFRSSKPDYFGDLPWPPFDSEDDPEGVSIEYIPAGYRYINGDDPPSESTLTCTTLNVNTLTLG